MNPTIFLWTFLLLGLLPQCLLGQELDTAKLNRFMESLEARDEAMGSLAISKDGQVLYQKAIGYRYISEDQRMYANTDTRYRIWSITKTFTATLIFQLIEEGKLSLDTYLNQFYPQVAHADQIQIRHMLSHTSGIRDFTRDPEPIWDGRQDTVTNQDMVRAISGYTPDFLPGEVSSYSNSNFLLLGYILEEIEQDSYSRILKKRISDRIGLTCTSYYDFFPDKEKNEAFSYVYQKGWEAIEEGNATGPVPGPAGDIISTPTNLLQFIEALFAGGLVSSKSVATMADVENHGGMGLYGYEMEGIKGVGHSGAYRTYADLMYFPEEGLAIAYCTNGQMYNYQDILKHVLRIYQQKPFGISLSRPLLLTVTLFVCLIFIAFMGFGRWSWLSTNPTWNLSWALLFVYLLGQGVATFLYGGYDWIQEPMIVLNTYYGGSASWMGIISSLVFVLSSLFFGLILRNSLQSKRSIIPLLPIAVFCMAHLGQALFPSPHPMAIDFDQMPILLVLGPILTLIFWRKTLSASGRNLTGLSLALILIPLAFFLLRPVVGHITYAYGGLLQRVLYLGIYVWFLALGWQMGKQLV